MRTMRNTRAINELLAKGGILSVSDFVKACEGMPIASVYSRIHALIRSGRIQPAGRGQYTTSRSLNYKVEITPLMKEVNSLLIESLPSVQHCIYERDRNLIVEVASSDIIPVFDVISEHYDRVGILSEIDKIHLNPSGYILIGKLISDSPVFDVGDIPVPTLEKSLVDTLSRSPEEASTYFRKAFDVYQINTNRLNRYAARRGLSEELSECLESLSQSRIKMFSLIRNYFSTLPVEKAWVFGSFSRGEETADSDIDILVSYTPEADISLLAIIRWKLDLEKITGRSVDLVENGYLKPFATDSANHDKYLIYERAH